MKKGDYVIARAVQAGVFAGELVDKNGGEITLKNARKIYYWKGANTVEDIAVKGLDAENSKITIVAPEIVIDGVCQVIVASPEAEKIIKGTKIWTA